METVIRSPQKGVIKKLAHKEGVCSPGSLSPLNCRSVISTNITLQDICKAGTVLVLFEGEASQEGDAET
jgi:3-methylcrotonyl-CoA carboxylase alpha subunit